MQESGLRQKKIVSNQQNKKVASHTRIGCTQSWECLTLLVQQNISNLLSWKTNLGKI